MIDVPLVLLVLVGTACPSNPEQREASICFERKVTMCTEMEIFVFVFIFFIFFLQEHSICCEKGNF